MRAQCLGGRIVPAEVRAGGPSGQGNIDPVIDEHGHRQRGHERLG